MLWNSKGQDKLSDRLKRQVDEIMKTSNTSAKRKQMELDLNQLDLEQMRILNDKALFGESDDGNSSNDELLKRCENLKKGVKKHKHAVRKKGKKRKKMSPVESSENPLSETGSVSGSGTDGEYDAHQKLSYLDGI